MRAKDSQTRNYQKTRVKIRSINLAVYAQQEQNRPERGSGNFISFWIEHAVLQLLCGGSQKTHLRQSGRPPSPPQGLHPHRGLAEQAITKRSDLIRRLHPCVTSRW